MLEGVVAENVSDLELRHLTVRPLSVNIELVSLSVETGCDSIVSENRIVEVGEDRLLGGHIHGPVVIRAQPLLVGIPVAIDTLVPAHELGCRHHHLDRPGPDVPLLE